MSAESAAFWRRQGLETLKRSLHRVQAANPAEARRVAKNVIVFIGDGMGVSTTTAARIYKGQRQGRVGPEGASLAWERFPSLGLFKVSPSLRVSFSNEFSFDIRTLLWEYFNDIILKRLRI